MRKKHFLYIFCLMTVLLIFCNNNTYAEITLNKDELSIQTPSFSENKLLDGVDFYSITTDIVTGNFKVNDNTIINKAINLFFKEVRNSIYILVLVLVIGLLYSLVSALQGSFNKNGISQVSFFVCYLIICTISFKAVQDGISLSIQAISLVYDFIAKLAPLILTYTIASGGINAAMLFKPLLFGSVYTIEYMVKYFFMPAITLFSATAMVSHLNDNLQLKHLNDFIEKIIKMSLTFVVTIFITLTTIYGFTAPTLDVIGAKTAKFAVSNFVPIVGGALSDALETVAATTQIVKNATGVAGIVIIILTLAYPALKLTVMTLLFKLTAAVIEPITDSKITGLIDNISKVMTMLLSVVIVSAVCCIVVISVIIATTNGGGLK